MEKFSETESIIKNLRNAAAAISEAANALEGMLTTATGDAPTEPPAETRLTLEQVRAVLADKSRRGHTAAIRALLQKYGATKLSGIDPACYKALLADAEVLSDAD